MPYVDEQMAEYRQRTDRNGNEYRNVILQWENGFSNNDKEVLTIVSCYYEQDWETDMSPLGLLGRIEKCFLLHQGARTIFLRWLHEPEGVRRSPR